MNLAEHQAKKARFTENGSILVTCECAPNIALIKYWGKQSEELMTPLNSSVSITLDTNVLNSKTSVMLQPRSVANQSEKTIRIWFDGKSQEYNENEFGNKKADLLNRSRLFKILKTIKSNCDLHATDNYLIRICSRNNFPTACGLASSASGFACLALCLKFAFGYHGDVSEIARFGSGSACRSVAGGFVKWHAPDPNGNPQESISTQLYNSSYWKEMNILALVLHDRKKDSSSTDGMRLSTETSELLPHRVQIVEGRRLGQLESALARKDFNELGQIIMQDSNCFHAICLDTQPPLFYLNDKSKEIIRLVNEFNKYKGDRIRVAYSFDAGPNAFLFLLDEDLNEFLSLIRYMYFGGVNKDEFIADKLMTKMSKAQKEKLVEEKHDFGHFEASFKNADTDLIKYIIHSKVGDDPKVVLGNDLDESLMDLNGNPKGERV